MTLKRRLARLETEAAQSPDALAAVREHFDTLLPLFVQTELVWWPWRWAKTSRRVAVAVEEQRRRYREVGLPWSGVGGNATNWKRAERQRAAMVAAGLVQLTSRKGVPFVRLSDSAITFIRALLGLPQLDRVARVLRVAAAALFNEQSLVCRPGRWVSETRLSGMSYEQRADASNWLGLESKLVPLLIWGALESHSSTVGHIYYRSSGTEPAYIDDPAVAVDESLQDKYFELWSLASRADWTPEDTSEIWIPLSATR